MNRRLIVRARAHLDIDEALTHYLGAAPQSVAHAFVDALEAAYRSILEHPALGSPRFGVMLDMDGLRSKPVEGFPHIVFYLDTPSPEIIRVLHSARDIAAALEGD